MNVGIHQTPSWSPDGRRIAYFATDTDGTDHIYVMRSDGTERKRLIEGLWPSWSPDGAHILFGAPDGLTVMKADGSDRRLMVPGDAKFGTFSPQGDEIAYVATEAGRVWVYVMESDGTDRRAILSRPAPTW